MLEKKNCVRRPRPGKTYEASAAPKCLHFGMVEPKGVALAQQVRDDMESGVTVGAAGPKTKNPIANYRVFQCG